MADVNRFDVTEFDQQHAEAMDRLKSCRGYYLVTEDADGESVTVDAGFAPNSRPLAIMEQAVVQGTDIAVQFVGELREMLVEVDEEPEGGENE